MELVNLILLKLFIIDFLPEGPLFSLDVKLAHFHLEGARHFALHLPQLLRGVRSHCVRGFVRVQGDLDNLQLSRGELRHILFQNMISIESDNEGLYQIQTVQLVVRPLTGVFKMGEKAVCEDVVAQLLLLLGFYLYL